MAHRDFIMNKKLPKIIFRHSWIYDRTIERLSAKKKRKAPAKNRFQKHIKNLSKEWGKIGNKILKELSKVAKLRWRDKEIRVYVTDGVVPFSDPLTLNLRSSIHTLTHELIHVILSQRQNGRQFQKNWDYLMNKYKKEIPKAGGNLRGHIIVHAIHWHIMDKFFDKRTLQKEMKSVKHPDYLRSWEIVKKDGYKQIIKDLTRGLKI